MSIAHRLLATTNSLIPLPLRIAAGLVFYGHGAQKLFGWYGGPGLEGTVKAFADHGMDLGTFLVAMVACAEFFGGVFLLLGLFTRYAAIALIVTMAGAIILAHSSAFFLQNNGMEYALTLLLINVSLLMSGAGGISLDRIFFGKSH
jgi:putative oxidoreductase